MSRSLVGVDCESHLIGPGEVTPRLVCATFADASGALLLGNGDSILEVFLKETFANDHITGHNFSFDMAVFMRAYPKLIPTIFKALEEGRVHDSLLREKLTYLGTTGDLENFHGKRVEYGLAALAYRRLGVDLSASKSGPDIWRLRFGELDGKPASAYPREAADYAKKDASIARELFLDQGKQPEADRLLKVEPLHVKASLCLQLMSSRGLKVDSAKKKELEGIIDQELATLKLVYESGLITPAQPPREYAKQPGKFTQPQKEKVNKSKVLQPLVLEVCKKDGKKIKPTAKGKEGLKEGKFTLETLPLKFVSTASDFLKEIAHLHPALQEFVFREERIKLKRDYFPALEWPMGSGITAESVHPRYDALKKTGRVSSQGNSKKHKDPLFPSVHIQGASAVKIGPNKETVRDVYVARPGFVYAVADYNAIDLCALAQTLHDLFGGSALEDQINGGIDPHAFLGAVLAVEEDSDFRTQCDRKQGEEIFWSFESNKALKSPCGCVGKVKHKEGWYEHWRTFAKVFGLGVPGGMGLDTLCAVAAGYGLAMDRDTASRLRKRYFRVHPEVRRYLRHWVPEQQDPTSSADNPRFRYTSPMGMVRAGCTYTEFANGRALQTPAAEGFKQAMWLVTRECYDAERGSVLFGSYPVVNMHDELVVEVPEDGREAERAERLSQLMIEGMNTVLKDVVIRAEPVLTRRWSKRAKSVRNAEGKLVVWEEVTA